MAEPLSPDRWGRLEALYLAAAELPVGERAPFVARECGSDAALARDVLGMLARDGDAAPKLAGIVATAAQRLAPNADWVGRRLGHYRVVREIGRGGMGLVFEAVRDDDEYHKRVAVKLAHWWRDSGASRARFRAERQFLAELEHPHIARLLDGGAVDGTPYLVMEFVEGQPITIDCTRRLLGLPARLDLFCRVCDAVRFAHERLIVHRDLKPANILVNAEGAPKLLDFGIATLLDPLADGAATAGEPIWTPDYASPEQVRGLAVTTRTDVYSLGLVLYELLAGVRAQVGDTSSPIALDRSVCDVVPPPPSAAAAGRGDAAQSRRLQGDLDTIVMTAIAKEPERRYSSVAALADDIRHCLAGRPILARPATWRYVGTKWLRRHGIAAAGAGVLAVSVVAGAASTLYQARRAEGRFNDVRALANAFVFDIHDRIVDLPGATDARKAIVERALIYLENLRADAGGDAELSKELAAAYKRVGDVQGHPLSANLGDQAGAVASYRRAEDLLRPLVARRDRDAMVQLTTVTRDLASMAQAAGDLKATLAGYGESLQLAEQVLRLEPGNQDALSRVAEVSSDVARIAYQSRDLALAERAGHRAMEAARALVERDPANRQHRESLATAHNALGATFIMAGRLEDAAGSFRESVAVRERLVADDPLNASFRRTLMVSYGNLGDVLGYRVESLGDFAGARAALEKAVALGMDAVRQDPSDRRAQFDVASARLRLGGVMAEDPATRDRGIDELAEADRLTADLLASEPSSDRYGYLHLITGWRMGAALARADRRAEAVRLLDRVRAAAPAFMKGPNQPAARSTHVEATIIAARIRAEEGHPEAAALAEWSERELATPIGTGVTVARAHGELGRAFLKLAERGGAQAPAWATKAVSHLETSAALWKAATLAPALDSAKAGALARIETDLTAARRLRR